MASKIAQHIRILFILNTVMEATWRTLSVHGPVYIIQLFIVDRVQSPASIFTVHYFLEPINYSSELPKYKHDDFFSGLTMILLQWIMDFSGYLVLMWCNKSWSFMIGSELHTSFFHVVCPTLLRFLRVILLKISDNFKISLD